MGGGEHDPRAGERVEHFVHGSGTLIEKLAFGRLRVRFDRAPNLPRTIDRDELLPPPSPSRAEPEGAGTGAAKRGSAPAGPARIAAAAVPAPAAPPPPPPAPLAPAARPAPAPLSAEALPKLTLDQASAWQTLEALRLGVVPSRGTADYTVGRAAELEALRALLRQGHGCRFLWGDYGSGKTHLLEAFEQQALEAGHAVARLTLDPREQALHHPRRLYQQIARGLRVPGRPVSGLAGLFDGLSTSPEHKAPHGRQASRFFSPVLFVESHGDEDLAESFQSYARGEDVEMEELNAVLARLRWGGERLLTLSDYRTYGRMYAHLIGTLAVWAEDAGHRGLVLLFDEVERVEALSPAERHYAQEVLQHFAALALPAEQLAFDPEALYKGGQPVHRALPLRFRPEQPLCAVFAVTPLEETDAWVRRISTAADLHLRLSTLHQSLHSELVLRLVRLYARAYPGFAPGAGLEARLLARLGELVADGHDSQRTLVRQLVFGLDQERLGPGPGSPASDSQDF